MNYNKRTFKVIKSTENGAVSSETVFQYIQVGKIVTCEYRGKDELIGHLIGLVDDHGVIDMRYHQVDNHGVLMTGICTSVPEIMSNGKIRINEAWQWTSGDHSEGKSTLEEV